MHAELSHDGRRVRLVAPDGGARELTARWLFDHADDARDPASGQRPRGALASAERIDGTEIDGEVLRLTFAGGAERRLSLRALQAASRPQPECRLWLTP